MRCRTTPTGRQSRATSTAPSSSATTCAPPSSRGWPSTCRCRSPVCRGLMAIGRIPVDVALIQVSLPDEFGYVSLGVSVDVIPAAGRQGQARDRRGQPGHAAVHGRLDRAHRPDPPSGAGRHARHRVRASGDVEDRPWSDCALHRRHHRRRLHAADRPGPRHQRGAEVPGRPPRPRHPLRRHHRRHHPAAGERHPHRRAQDASQRGKIVDQLRHGLAAAVRPDRPQSAVLVPADRGGVPPDHDRRAAPDGVGDAGLRRRPDGPGLRRPVRRRVLRRHRGAGRVPAGRVALRGRQGDHLPCLHRRRRRDLAHPGDRCDRGRASPSRASTCTT